MTWNLWHRRWGSKVIACGRHSFQLPQIMMDVESARTGSLGRVNLAGAGGGAGTVLPGFCSG